MANLSPYTTRRRKRPGRIENEGMAKDKLLWWFSSVILAIIPFALLLALQIFGLPCSFLTIIGNGELILTSFSISGPLLIELFVFERALREIKLILCFLISFLLVILQIFLFTGIKFMVNPPEWNICILSISVLLLTVWLSSRTKNHMIALGSEYI